MNAPLLPSGVDADAPAMHIRLRDFCVVTVIIFTFVGVPATMRAFFWPPRGMEMQQTEKTIKKVAPKKEKKSRGLFKRHAPPSILSVAPSFPATSAVATYYTGNSVKSGKMMKELDDLLAVGGNAVVFDVKGSFVYFHSAAPMATEQDMVQPLYDLPQIVADAKAKGLYTIARYIAVKDGIFTERVPDAQLVFPSGRRHENGWVDPSNEKALTYNRQILQDVVKSGVDEINLDYIRFSTDAPVALSAFTGQQKADKVEKFVQMARQVITDENAKTKLGLSTYAILGWNYPVNLETLGQDVVRFAPLVDVISPMAYPSTFAEGAYYNPAKHPGSRAYYLVYRTLTGYQKLLGEHAWKLRPWIQGYSMDAQDIRDEMQAVSDAGLCGFAVWNASNSYGPALEAMKTWQPSADCKPML